MSVNLAKHFFTVREYDRMGETGVFAPGARVELIEGEIIEMSPIGSRHAACVNLISDVFNEQLRSKAIVRSQNPIILDDFSEPEPEVSVLRFREDYYRDGHPRPQDVLLIVEVAETTVPFDRQIKLPLYARVAIPEYLIFNLPDEVVEYYSQPEMGTYNFTRLLTRGDRFESAVVTGLTLDVETILG
jgi:Uma2 family endonuclease